MPSMEEIRERFPNPVRNQDSAGKGDCYCIGGACFRFFAWENNAELYDPFFIKNDWPQSHELGILINKWNPILSPVVSEVYADEIIVFNDLGFFEDAWNILKQALTSERREDIYAYLDKITENKGKQINGK